MITEILLAFIIILIGCVSYFLKDKFEKFETIFDTVKYNIKAIANSLSEADEINFNHSHLRDYSPLSITEEGEKYLEITGFIQIVSEQSDKFFKVIDLENPTTKYDVEVNAVKSVLALLDEEYFRPVKIYFYNHPKEDIRGFAKIAGVYLRDKYLEKHPEITQ